MFADMNEPFLRITFWQSHKIVEKSASSGIARELLENECRVMTLLEGVNAPKIVDVEASTSNLILRRVFLPGITLLETPKEKWPALLTKLGENLKTVHMAGLIHGDLKPENLIVQKNEITPIDWEHALPIGRRIADLPLRAASLGTSAPRLIWAKGNVSIDLDLHPINCMFDIAQ